MYLLGSSDDESVQDITDEGKMTYALRLIYVTCTSRFDSRHFRECGRL